MIGAETVTVVRADRVIDSQGSLTPQRDWDNAASRQVSVLSVQPAGTTDVRDARGVEVTAGWRLFTQRGQGIDLVEGDRVLWAGLTLEVVGAPQKWNGPSGGVHHWEVDLREQPPTVSGATDVTSVLRAGVQAAADESRVWTP